MESGCVEEIVDAAGLVWMSTINRIPPLRKQEGQIASPLTNDDGPTPEEFSLNGGSWSGHLLENPKLGLTPQLTWTFDVAFAEIKRDYGVTSVGLTIDWVPLQVGSWQEMVGAASSSDSFANPIETSIYFFEHHRFDRVELEVREQRGRAVRLTAEAEGDIDQLGIPSLAVDEWLSFDGISVHLVGVSTVKEAAEQLGAFTDTGGLEGRETHPGIFRFSAG